MAIAVFPMLIAVGLLIGLIVLLIKQPKAGLMVLGGLAVLVVLLFAFYGTVRVHHVATVESRPQLGALPAEWEADLYASPRAAMLSRVPLMGQVIRGLTGGAYRPEHIHVTGDMDIDLLREFAERLEKEPDFEGASITRKPASPLANEAVIHINVNMLIERGRQPQWWSHGVLNQGRVMVTAARGGRTSSAAHARFMEKPWAEEWSSFVGSIPSGQNWLRAESGAPATSSHEAHQQAIDQAVEMLMPMVQTSHRGPLPLRQDLHNELRARVAQGRLVSDRFVQRVDRPYGELYTAMLLIDGSPAAVSGLAAEVTQGQVVRRREVLSTAGSLAALMGVIALLYLFLNSVTKGYYRPQLVVVMMVAAAVVVVVVMMA